MCEKNLLSEQLKSQYQTQCTATELKSQQHNAVILGLIPGNVTEFYRTYSKSIVQELCLVGDTAYVEVGSTIRNYQPEKLNQKVYEPGCVTQIYSLRKGFYL